MQDDLSSARLHTLLIRPIDGTMTESPLIKSYRGTELQEAGLRLNPPAGRGWGWGTRAS